MIRGAVTITIAALMATVGLTVTGATPAQAQTCAFSSNRDSHPDFVRAHCTDLDGWDVYRIWITCTNSAGNLIGKLSSPWREEGSITTARCTLLTPSYVTNTVDLQVQ